MTIALDIIDTLALVPELNLSALARRIGVAKSTAHRTCSVLVERGLLDRTPRGRLGTALDIANGVLFLASDEASLITGSELVIDGGMTAQ